MLSKYFKFVLVLTLALSSFTFVSLAHAATISLLPANGNVVTGQAISVGVVVSTPDQAMNAASGVISFPPDLLEVTSISKGGSVVGLWVQEPSFSNVAGTVNFEGVVLNPGFTGANGRVLSVNFRAKKAGTANLTFLTPNVLANDGEGTNILTSAGGARFQIGAGSEPAVLEPTTTSQPALVVTSSTHPDQDSWYRATTAKFQWRLPDGATAVRLLADSSRATTPSLLYDPPVTEKEVADLQEGVSYFHAQVKLADGWAPATHFRLQIDTTPPDHLTLSEVARLDPMDPKVKLKFDASDKLSGLDHYEIVDGNSAPEVWRGAAGEVYESPALEPGSHTISVRAYDRAGNMLASSIIVEVQAPPSEWWTLGQKTLSSLSLAIPLLAVIMLLGWMLERSHARVRAWRRKIRKEVHEAEESIERAFDLIREDMEKQLGTLERAKTKRTLTREEGRIMTNIRKNLRLAERFIKKELDDIEKEVK